MDLGNISLTSIPEIKGIVTEEIPSTPFPTDSSPLEVELVFPMQATPLVVVGIPKYLLPIHGPEMQSHYRCQFTDCTQISLQKAAACMHIYCYHLNVALACLYCSGRENPKMYWFSSSTWEKDVHKHSQDGLPLFPDDPAFTQLSLETLPSTSSSTPGSLPLEVILDRAKAARQCLVEESKSFLITETLSSPRFMLKQARNREMSKLTRRFPLVTIFSHLKQSLTQATPSPPWSLPSLNHRVSSLIYTI